MWGRLVGDWLGNGNGDGRRKFSESAAAPSSSAVSNGRLENGGGKPSRASMMTTSLSLSALHHQLRGRQREKGGKKSSSSSNNNGGGGGRMVLSTDSIATTTPQHKVSFAARPVLIEDGFRAAGPPDGDDGGGDAAHRRGIQLPTNHERAVSVDAAADPNRIAASRRPLTPPAPIARPSLPPSSAASKDPVPTACCSKGNTNGNAKPAYRRLSAANSFLNLLMLRPRSSSQHTVMIDSCCASTVAATTTSDCIDNHGRAGAQKSKKAAAMVVVPNGHHHVPALLHHTVSLGAPSGASLLSSSATLPSQLGQRGRAPSVMSTSMMTTTNSVNGHHHNHHPPRRRRPRSAHYDPAAALQISQSSPSTSAFVVPDVNTLYRRIERLGEGSYATVYKCESRYDGSIVAIKEIKLQSQEGLPFTAIREASLLRALRHANIVCLHDIFHQPGTLTFVFQYMACDLAKWMERRPDGAHPVHVQLLLLQLLRGLAYCHERKILHRDLKPQNLLLSEDGELKLADFGLARAKSVPSRTFSHEVVTLWYRPPDVLLGSTNYSTSLDMWGVGCILSEVCTGTALFPGSRDVVDQLERIFAVRGAPDPIEWPEVLDLPGYIADLFPTAAHEPLHWLDVHLQHDALAETGMALLSALLQLDPRRRITARAALLHPYFASLPAAVHLLKAIDPIFAIDSLRRAWDRAAADEQRL